MNDLIKIKKVCIWYMSGCMGEYGDIFVFFLENFEIVYG